MWPGVSMMLTWWSFQRGGDGGRGNGDAALLLLLHEIHHRLAVVDLAGAVDEPGEEEDALGGGGLAGVDVGDDADIADFLNYGRFHFRSLLLIRFIGICSRFAYFPRCLFDSTGYRDVFTYP